MKNIITLDNILDVVVTYYGNEITTPINFGSLLLENEGRQFILDVSNSYREFKEYDYETTIRLDLEIDKEIFTDCNFDLTQDDLLSDSLSAKIFIDSEELSTDETTRTLFVRVDGCTKAIDLDLD